jgi:SAM-dependent methyltransferase
MGRFDELVGEAEAAEVSGWDFDWLNGRAIEERPTWRYFDQVSHRAAEVQSMLEIQAGTGAMTGSLPRLLALAAATEGFEPNVALAAARLRAQSIASLPFRNDSFDLVISRHPISPWWQEIARVLRPGGSYFAQHVGPYSLRSLSEFLMGPLPNTSNRRPDTERNAAERAGLTVKTLLVEWPPTIFFDIGAVVYFLRMVPWIVPDFQVDRYRPELQRLHDAIEFEGRFETTASRMLIDARKPEQSVS